MQQLLLDKLDYNQLPSKANYYHHHNEYITPPANTTTPTNNNVSSTSMQTRLTSDNIANLKIKHHIWNTKLPKVLRIQSPKTMQQQQNVFSVNSPKGSYVLNPTPNNNNNNANNAMCEDNLNNHNKSTHRNPKILKGLPDVFSCETPVSCKHNGNQIDFQTKKPTENHIIQGFNSAVDTVIQDKNSFRQYAPALALITKSNHHLNSNSKITVLQTEHSINNRIDQHQNYDCESPTSNLDYYNGINHTGIEKLSQPTHINNSNDLATPRNSKNQYNKLIHQLEIPNSPAKLTNHNPNQGYYLKKLIQKNINQQDQQSKLKLNSFDHHEKDIPLIKILGQEDKLDKPMNSLDRIGNNHVSSAMLNNNKRINSARRLASSSPENLKKLEIVTGILDHEAKVNAPESFLKIPKFNLLIDGGFRDKITLMEQSRNAKGMKISSNELITLRKSTMTSGIGLIKKVLHTPSFEIYDVEEFPLIELKNQHDMKTWIQKWKTSFLHSKNVQKIYTAYWNSPEGYVSLVTEPAKNGYLLDLIECTGGLPEKCLQSIGKDILNGIIEMQVDSTIQQGELNLDNIYFSDSGRAKLGSNFSSFFNARTLNHKQISPESKSPSNTEGLPICNIDHTSRDIFNFGLILLECALSPLEIYDSRNYLTCDNLKLILVGAISSQGSYSTSNASTRNTCCILHDEEYLRKSFGTLSTSHSTSGNGGNGVGSKQPLVNNFSTKSPSKSILDKNNNIQPTLLEIIQNSKRYSDVFIDLLCSCLKINYTQRLNAKALINHEFFSKGHISLGPNITILELLNIKSCLSPMISISRESKDIMEHVDDSTRMDKFIEGLKMTLMNADIKSRFMKVFKSSTHEMKADNKKILQISTELQCNPNILWKKITEEVINDLIQILK